MESRAGETATCLYLHPLAVEMGAGTFVNSLNAYHERARGREYSAQATVASKLKKAESARIDDVAIRRRPHHASDGPNAHLRRACVRKNSKHPQTPAGKVLCAFSRSACADFPDAGCACLRWRPWKTAVLLVILADPLEGRGWDVLREWAVRE